MSDIVLTHSLGHVVSAYMAQFTSDHEGGVLSAIARALTLELRAVEAEAAGRTEASADARRLGDSWWAAAEIAIRRAHADLPPLFPS